MPPRRDDTPGPIGRAVRAGRALAKGVRPEEGLLVLGFLASACLTIYANVDLYQQGIRSRAIRGGLLRLAIVLGLAALLPVLERALHKGIVQVVLTAPLAPDVIILVGAALGRGATFVLEDDAAVAP